MQSDVQECCFSAAVSDKSRIILLLFLTIIIVFHRANSMRALGSLIQCFDSMASRGFAGGGREGLAFAIASQRELQDLCQQVHSGDLQ